MNLVLELFTGNVFESKAGSGLKNDDDVHCGESTIQRASARAFIQGDDTVATPNFSACDWGGVLQI